MCIAEMSIIHLKVLDKALRKPISD